jgi:alpha-glucoside transport system substrate-binding protein
MRSGWRAGQGFLTPLKSVNADLFWTTPSCALGEILTSATTFRFDGSDLMPGGVGAGSFWTGMVDYTGGEDAKKVAGNPGQLGRAEVSAVPG